MSEINSGGGAGVHPGAPMIWPTSKKKVEQVSSSEEVSAASRQVNASSLKSASQAAPTQQAAQAKEAAKAMQPETRPMALGDIVEQLVGLNIPTTANNKQLASYMMQHGVELSYDSLGELFRLLKGRTGKHELESAVVSLSKGLAGLGRSVDVLSSFFAKQLAANQKAQQLQAMLAQFQSQKAPAGLDKSVFSALSQAVAMIDDELKGFKKSADMRRGFKTSGLVKDLSTFSQFLNGVEQQLLATKKQKGGSLHQVLKQMKGGVYDMLDSLLAQSILSSDSKYQQSAQHETFFYWAFPNPFSADKDMEVLAQKDPRNPDEINPKRTRLVVKLETDDIGEIAVTIDILDDQVWYVFSSEREETHQAISSLNDSLKERLKELDFRLSGFQSNVEKIDLKSLLLPRFNLDDVVRIQVEV